MPTSRLTQQSAPSEPDVPHQLLEPNYQNRLRIVGRALDENGLDKAVILETGEGFFLRAFDPDDEKHVTDTFTNERLMQTLRVAIYSRVDSDSGRFRSALRPTGYEDFLRALGYRLDRRGVEAVAIVECSRYFHVSGEERIGNEFQTAMTPFDELYEVPGVNRLVNEAVARRGGKVRAGDPADRPIEADLPVRIIRTGSRRP